MLIKGEVPRILLCRACGLSDRPKRITVKLMVDQALLYFPGNFPTRYEPCTLYKKINHIHTTVVLAYVLVGSK